MKSKDHKNEAVKVEMLKVPFASLSNKCLQDLPNFKDDVDQGQMVYRGKENVIKDNLKGKKHQTKEANVPVVNKDREIKREIDKIKRNSAQIVFSVQQKLKTEDLYQKINYILSDSKILYDFAEIWKSKEKENHMKTSKKSDYSFYSVFHQKFKSISKEQENLALLTKVCQIEKVKNQGSIHASLSKGFSSESISKNLPCQICKKPIFKMKDKLVFLSKNSEFIKTKKVFHKFCYKIYKQKVKK